MFNNIRALSRALCLLALVALSTFSFATLVQAAQADAVVATSLLRIHSGPLLTSGVVGTATQGTQVTLDGRDTGAIWLHGKTDGGVIGWMSRPYLSIRLSLNVLSLPVLGSNASVSAPVVPTSSAGNTAPVTVAGRLSGAFELGGQIQDLGANTISALNRAGMHWIKRQIGVGDGQSATWISQAHGAGFKILLSVKGDKNAVLNPGYFNQYAGYVATLAQQGVDAVEVWNEANLDREWPNGHIDPALYTQLLAAAYNAIKKTNANTMVISGAPSPTGAGVTSAYWNDDVFYAGMARAGAGRYADCIGAHYNEGIVGPLQISGDPRDNYPTRYFSTMLARALASFPGKKACFTELGYLTSQGYGSLPNNFSWARNTTLAQQVAWLAQAAVRASASGRVRLMIIWNVDMTYYGPDDPMAGFAMIRPGGGCPACDTLGQVSH